jgi:hypothetical protein
VLIVMGNDFVALRTNVKVHALGAAESSSLERALFANLANHALVFNRLLCCLNCPGKIIVLRKSDTAKAFAERAVTLQRV